MRERAGKMVMGLGGCLAAYALLCQSNYYDFKDFLSLVIAAAFLVMAGWVIKES